MLRVPSITVLRMPHAFRWNTHNDKMVRHFLRAHFSSWLSTHLRGRLMTATGQSGPRSCHVLILLFALLLSCPFSLHARAAEVRCIDHYSIPLQAELLARRWPSGARPNKDACNHALILGPIQAGDYEKVRDLYRKNHPFLYSFSLASPGWKRHRSDQNWPAFPTIFNCCVRAVACRAIKPRTVLCLIRRFEGDTRMPGI